MTSDHQTNEKDTILVVDDNKNNLDLMLVTLSEENYRLIAATSGERALKIINKVRPDLVLMDIQMPGMDGFETTHKIKAQPELKHIPVLFLSALNDLNNIVKCFQAGGVDYISKPFKKEELLARVRTHLSIKNLQAHIINDRDKISSILNNILPSSIVEQLKNGQKPQPEFIDDVVVLFTDFTDFTNITKQLGAVKSIEYLNTIFSAFDKIVSHFGLERIKTIGDAYMAAGGVNSSLNNSGLRGILAGLKMQEYLELFNKYYQTDRWQLRAGVNNGSVMTGIVGVQRIAFDIWGDTVNLASRLENHSKSYGVAVTDRLYQGIADNVEAEKLGKKHLHNWGEANLYQCFKLNRNNADASFRQLYDNINLSELLEHHQPERSLLDEILLLS